MVCDRERRQERRRGDQWQRDDHHVLLVLRFATREQRYRKAQSQLCQHARPLCERNEIPQLSTCATERATQRSPLGTQQGALPDVGPES